MTEEKRTAGSRDLSSSAELYDVYDNCDSDEKWIQEMFFWTLRLQQPCKTSGC